MPNDRGLLVGVAIRGQPELFSLEDSLSELARLAETAGVVVVDVLTQTIEAPNPATYIGKGKLDELVTRVHAEGIGVVIFDNELNPRQQREIEKAINNDNVKVLDRTALILDIFAQHARTREGALQVELAQYEYRLPRLTRAWTHLARQVGGRAGGATGGVGVRGPGETQLESDRREIRKRIAFLRRQLEEVRTHREQYRLRRRAANIPLIALVGYTNAGKSTLLNALSGADVLAVDQLFATLDPTTRRFTLPSGREALLTDTVGFIQKLPTQLVAAFRATLEEILEADLLLHVVDVSHPNVIEQASAVEDVLDELGAMSIPAVVALNKVDRLAGRPIPPDILEALPDAVPISALTGEGLDRLQARLDDVLEAQLGAAITVLIPYDQGELVDLFHRLGHIDHL
ncbi:MAG: GTPase HflX, partial [Caldilineales bacterium]|nr:GTPase HflX [Caldilineales bacterium]